MAASSEPQLGVKFGSEDKIVNLSWSAYGHRAGFILLNNIDLFLGDFLTEFFVVFIELVKLFIFWGGLLINRKLCLSVAEKRRRRKFEIAVKVNLSHRSSMGAD